MKYEYKGKKYSSRNDLYEDYKDKIEISKGYFSDLLSKGYSIEEALSKKKQTNKQSKRGSYIVEGIAYISLPAIAKAYDLTDNAVYGRYRRGKRGDDLVPPKKRKSYVEEVKVEKFKFEVNGIRFKSEAEACRYFDIKFSTYRARKYKGYSLEECLGVKENSKLGNYKQQLFHKSKPVTVEGVTYPSQAEVSRAYGKTPEQVRAQMDKGRTLEEALGINQYDIPTTIEYRGKKYKSKRELARAFDIDEKRFQSRIGRGYSIEEAVSAGKDKVPLKGRFNKTILEREPEFKNKIGYLYFVKLFFDSKAFFKIGITSRDIDTRLKNLNYEEICSYQNELINCYELEQKILDKYNKNRIQDNEIIGIDGYTEILDLDDIEIADIKQIIEDAKTFNTRENY